MVRQTVGLIILTDDLLEFSHSDNDDRAANNLLDAVSHINRAVDVIKVNYDL